MRQIIAIRTHKWGEQEERLFDQLSGVPGHDLAVVFHDRPEALVPPLDMVDISDAWLGENGLRAVPDWGWRCGDYFYYALRAAKPAYSHYWLIEPDVYFAGAPADFFARYADDDSDVLGYRIAPHAADIAFARGLPELQRHQAIFALTRFSGRALDRLLALRRDYSARRIAPRFFTNDELFAFSHVVADGGFSHRNFEEIAPDWFENTQFSPSPDLLLETLEGNGEAAGRVFHPVHGRASFKRAIATRLAAGNAFLRNVRGAIRRLDEADIGEIAELAAANLRAELLRWHQASRTPEGPEE